jgi:uncharacterized protein involved in exopolysaccharide biosynthesis
LVEDKLQELNSKLTAAKADRLRLEGELRQIEQSGENIEALLAIPSISAAELVNEARRSVTQVEAEIATLALRYKERHPKMMAARAALAETKEKLHRAVMAQPAILRNAIEQAKATEANFQEALQGQQGAAVAEPCGDRIRGWPGKEIDRALTRASVRSKRRDQQRREDECSQCVEHSPP